MECLLTHIRNLDDKGYLDNKKSFRNEFTDDIISDLIDSRTDSGGNMKIIKSTKRLYSNCMYETLFLAKECLSDEKAGVSFEIFRNLHSARKIPGLNNKTCIVLSNSEDDLFEHVSDNITTLDLRAIETPKDKATSKMWNEITCLCRYVTKSDDFKLPMIIQNKKELNNLERTAPYSPCIAQTLALNVKKGNIVLFQIEPHIGNTGVLMKTILLLKESVNSTTGLTLSKTSHSTNGSPMMFPTDIEVDNMEQSTSTGINCREDLFRRAIMVKCEQFAGSDQDGIHANELSWLDSEDTALTRSSETNQHSADYSDSELILNRNKTPGISSLTFPFDKCNIDLSALLKVVANEFHQTSTSLFPNGQEPRPEHPRSRFFDHKQQQDQGQQQEWQFGQHQQKQQQLHQQQHNQQQQQQLRQEQDLHHTMNKPSFVSTEDTSTASTLDSNQFPQGPGTTSISHLVITDVQSVREPIPGHSAGGRSNSGVDYFTLQDQAASSGTTKSLARKRGSSSDQSQPTIAAGQSNESFSTAPKKQKSSDCQELWEWKSNVVLDSSRSLPVPHNIADLVVNWMKTFCLPKRLEFIQLNVNGRYTRLSYIDFKTAPDPHPTLKEVLSRIVAMENGNHHLVTFALDNGNGNTNCRANSSRNLLTQVVSYFFHAKGIGGFKQHVVLLPVSLCEKMELFSVQQVKENLLHEIFWKTSKFKVYFSHNIREYNVPFMVLFIVGFGELVYLLIFLTTCHRDKNC